MVTTVYRTVPEGTGLIGIEYLFTPAIEHSELKRFHADQLKSKHLVNAVTIRGESVWNEGCHQRRKDFPRDVSTTKLVLYP